MKHDRAEKGEGTYLCRQTQHIQQISSISMPISHVYVERQTWKFAQNPETSEFHIQKKLMTAHEIIWKIIWSHRSMVKRRNNFQILIPAKQLINSFFASFLLILHFVLRLD